MPRLGQIVERRFEFVLGTVRIHLGSRPFGEVRFRNFSAVNPDPYDIALNANPHVVPLP